MDQFNLEEDINDMDIVADGVDEEEEEEADILNETEVPKDVSVPGYIVVHALTFSSQKMTTSSSKATPTLASTRITRMRIFRTTTQSTMTL
jgi:hypothetical protein